MIFETGAKPIFSSIGNTEDLAKTSARLRQSTGMFLLLKDSVLGLLQNLTPSSWNTIAPGSLTMDSNVQNLDPNGLSYAI